MTKTICLLSLLLVAQLSAPAFADCGCAKAKSDCGCIDTPYKPAGCGCKKASSCGCDAKESCGCVKKASCGCAEQAGCGCHKKSCNDYCDILPASHYEDVELPDCCPQGQFELLCGCDRGEYTLLCKEDSKPCKAAKCDKCKRSCGCGKCKTPAGIRYRGDV